MKFVLMMGLVSLFADVAYEGARSANGSFLAVLGASGTAVGLVAGFGELVGYGFRLVSGIVSDRTKRYWALTIFGYTVNLLAVPALALAGNWPTAAALMVLERFGKSIRTPARDVMISQAGSEIGRGWAFAVHEAMDQIGAMTGPLVVSAVLWVRGDYRACYAALLLPAVLALAVLFIARTVFPHPHAMEKNREGGDGRGLTARFWWYLAAIGLVAAGTADFPLIAFHFERTQSVPRLWVPVYYSGAMGVDALAALVFGRWFDRRGVGVLMAVSLLSAFFAPLVFLGGPAVAAAGLALWAIGMGAQESVMRAALSDMLPSHKRGTAFGFWNIVYGLSWFAGSAVTGFLYDKSLPLVIIFSMACILASIPVFWMLSRPAR